MTNEQLEVLGILQEEAAEVIQAASKIRRSGLWYRPFGGEDTNLDKLHEELADFIVVMSIAQAVGLIDLDSFDMPSHMRAKISKLKDWSSISHEALDSIA